MSTNKHATIRYNELDRCFSNHGRKYFIEDLIEACNNALYENSTVYEGIKRRQIFDDIKFMESETFKTVVSITDWNKYFSDIKEKLANELNQLKTELQE